MVDAGQHERFLLEPSAGIGIFERPRGQDFNRNVPLQLFVMGAIDNAHPSLAGFLNNAVVGDVAANHRKHAHGNGVG
jgi:hypothetical protein